MRNGKSHFKVIILLTITILVASPYNIFNVCASPETKVSVVDAATGENIIKDLSPGQWAIGIYVSPSVPSPLNVTPTELVPDWSNVTYSPYNLSTGDIGNPVMTASKVTDRENVSSVYDPRLFYENGTWYMFFTVSSAVGEDIGLANSTDGINWNYSGIVLDEPFHVASPTVFKWEGNYYMVPETYTIKSVRLYTATNFPYNWSYSTTLISGGAFVESSVFRYNDTWWMFVGGAANRNCTIYYSSNLTELSSWKEHPMGPIVDNNLTMARPAGRTIVFNGTKIVRWATKCDVVFGETVRAFEVDTLTNTSYAEHEVSESPILTKSGSGWNRDGMHNVDPWWTGDRWLVAVDGVSSGVTVDGRPRPRSFTVNVTVSDVKGLYGWQVAIEFRTAFVDLTTAWLPENNIFKGKAPITAEIFENFPAEGYGYIMFGATLLTETVDVSGTGILFQMNFSVLGVGQTFLRVATKNHPVTPPNAYQLPNNGPWMPYAFWAFLSDIDMNEIDFNEESCQILTVGAKAPPIAIFTISPTVLEHEGRLLIGNTTYLVNEPIQFNASRSYDPDGYITLYVWNLGDGTIFNTTDPVTNHTYSKTQKSATVTLFVVDNDGLSSTTVSSPTFTIGLTVTPLDYTPVILSFFGLIVLWIVYTIAKNIYGYVKRRRPPKAQGATYP